MPSDVVIHRSQKIAELGGIDPAKGHTEETSTVTETETDTPDNTTTDTEYPTETQEYSEDPQTYSQDYTDTGYTETYYTDPQPYSDENYQDTYQDDGMYQDNGQAPADNVDGTGDQTWTEGGQ